MSLSDGYSKCSKCKGLTPGCKCERPAATMSDNHADILRDRAKGSRADHGELSVMADELEAAADRIEELEQHLKACREKAAYYEARSKRLNDLPWEEIEHQAGKGFMYGDFAHHAGADRWRLLLRKILAAREEVE